ncbi:teleost multiple tissue opsin 2b isoform X1 [Denticeps clupeoides]|uniref:G-protein coupled receptors family 1 profile domain-containing protein n=1 Tax=Denticeps clupeoides TaxID=299321 RepID=A0AAY4BMA3_9TELE|nr:parapinopsin-like isoform X1 [Denticeps clupeoides]
MFSDLADLNYSFNVSDGDPFLDEDWNDPPTQTLSGTGFIVLSVMLGLIMTFGFLNNLVVLILFCRFRALRTPVNMLLLNISVSDMLVCLLGTTLSFASSTQGRWLLGRRGCSWYGFINSCFGIVSLISLVVLSYDRYSTLAVYKKQGPDYRKPLLAVGGSWLYSLIWTVPPLLGWSSYDLEGAGTSCSVSWKLRTAQSHSYVICLFIFCLGLPVLVMMYCYARLLHAVKQVGKIRKSAVRRREYHVLFMVLTTVACYLICWLPYGVVALVATFGQPGIISPVASVVPSLLAKTSTVINPLIYILMNKQFYRCFLALFGCKCSLVESGPSSMPSKTTIMQLNRRIHCTAPATIALGEQGCSTPATLRTNPTSVT